MVWRASARRGGNFRNVNFNVFGNSAKLVSKLEFHADIQIAEQAIIDGKNTVLLAMATGTGKTRTVLGMIYRFLKTGRFKRILFL